MQQRLKLDLLEVENLKLQESLKIKASITESLEKENERMAKTMQPLAMTQPVKRL